MAVSKRKGTHTIHVTAIDFLSVVGLPFTVVEQTFGIPSMISISLSPWLVSSLRKLIERWEHHSEWNERLDGVEVMLKKTMQEEVEKTVKILIEDTAEGGRSKIGAGKRRP